MGEGVAHREGRGGGADEAEDEQPPGLGRPLLLPPPSALGFSLLRGGHLLREFLSPDSSSTPGVAGGQAHAFPDQTPLSLRLASPPVSAALRRPARPPGGVGGEDDSELDWWAVRGDGR